MTSTPMIGTSFDCWWKEDRVTWAQYVSSDGIIAAACQQVIGVVKRQVRLGTCEMAGFEDQTRGQG